MTNSSAAPKLLPVRLAVLLSAIGLAEGAIACWGSAPAPAWLPLSGVLPAALLPGVVAGSAVALALLAAPLLVPEGAELRLDQAAFAALWQALIAGFYLQTTARLTPLDGGGIVLAATVIFAVALTAALMAAVLPRAYGGLAFAWAVAVPVAAYMLAEVYLWATGGIFWRVQDGTPAHVCVHWLLALSPGTAAVGALEGSLADGSNCENAAFLLSAAVVSAAAAVWLTRRQARQPLPAAAFAGKDASRL